MERRLADGDFHSVVLFGIVASRDHHAAVDGQRKEPVIHEGRGHFADVDDVHAARGDAVDKRIRVGLRRKTPVPPDDDAVVLLLAAQVGAQGLANHFVSRLIQVFASDPANVVFTENVRLDLHSVLLPSDPEIPSPTRRRRKSRSKLTGTGQPVPKVQIPVVCVRQSIKISANASIHHGCRNRRAELPNWELLTSTGRVREAQASSPANSKEAGEDACAASLDSVRSLKNDDTTRATTIPETKRTNRMTTVPSLNQTARPTAIPSRNIFAMVPPNCTTR